MSAPVSNPPDGPTIRLGIPWVTACAAAEVLAIMAGFVVFWWKQRRRPGVLCIPDRAAAAGTACGNSRIACLLLLAFRACNFVWFIIFFAQETRKNANLAGKPHGSLTAVRAEFPPDYTTWCFYTQPWYWLLAVASSLMHLLLPEEGATATWVVRAGRYLRMCQWTLFEVILSSSWLVTLVVFTMLDPFAISIVWNRVSHMHFWNAVALSVEFSINRLVVRAGHFVLMMIWIITYVIFAWCMKATTWYTFVYWFMDLETPFALMWYPILAAIHVLVYFSLVAFSRRKERRIDRGGCCCACVYPRGEGSGGAGKEDAAAGGPTAATFRCDGA